MKVRFWGVRGSIPVPGHATSRYGGNTSCVEVRPRGGSPIIIDAGTGLRRLGKSLMEEAFRDGAGETSILISHTHWDHVQGLPFFSAGDRADSHVEVLLPEQSNGTSALDVLAGLMSPPYFPIGPMTLRGAWSFRSIAPGESEVAGFAVLAREIPHKGGRTFGYRVSDGHSSLAYLPDHNPTSLGGGADGFGEYHAAALELARDVDVLVHDAQLMPEELASEGDFGHAVADYAVALGERAGAGSVMLFHHRLDRTDDALDALEKRLAARWPGVSVAAEGVTLRL
jgi:phosphoribosyl 1,2-cyclic phosphodiesterase